MYSRYDIYSVTTAHVTGKILLEKGLKRCGAMTNGEKRQRVTTVCATSAPAAYIPPLFMYPRLVRGKCLPGDFAKDGPARSIYCCSKSGWITE